MVLDVDFALVQQHYWLVSAVLTAALLVVPSLLTQKNETKARPWPSVPGALPIVGNRLGGNGIENLTARMEEWASKYGGERGVFQTNLFGRNIVVLCSVEQIVRVTNARPFKMRRTTELNEAVNSVGAYGLFSAEGNTWKADRRVVAPALNKKNVRDYLPKVKLVSRRLIEKWRTESAGGKAVTINKDILNSGIDNIALIAFGEDFDTLRHPDNNQARDILSVFKTMNLRALSPVRFWRIPLIGQYFDGGGWPARRLCKSFEQLVHDYEVSSDDDRSKTFLGKLVALSKREDTPMSHERMIGNLVTVFSAAAETTHTTICSSLWEIATDSTGLQNELALEAQSLENFEDCTMDELISSLPRLRSLVYEVLRIRGPAPFIGVENSNEWELEGTSLPPDTSFFLLVRYASMLPDSGVRLGPSGELPGEFCARRWLVTESNGDGQKLSVLKPSASMGGAMNFATGFGSGMRLCPGRDLAEVEVLVCIASLLRNFEISLEGGHPQMKLVTRFTESPDIDIRLNLKPRNT